MSIVDDAIEKILADKREALRLYEIERERSSRLEETLRQKVFELEKRVKILELRLLDFAEIHSDLYFIKHTLKTRSINNENTIPETTRVC